MATGLSATRSPADSHPLHTQRDSAPLITQRPRSDRPAQHRDVGDASELRQIENASTTMDRVSYDRFFPRNQSTGT